MKKIKFKNNENYFDFINKYKDNIHVYMITFTRTMQINLFYDIM